MRTCTHCNSKDLIKAGRNPSGSQRYTCKACHRTTTLAPSPHGYAADVRARALRLYLEGVGVRAIGRQLDVNHQSVANWVNAYTATLPPAAPRPATPEIIEVDELFTFVQQKKTRSTSSWRSSARRAVSRAGRLRPNAAKRPSSR